MRSFILKAVAIILVAITLFGCSLAQINPLAGFKTAGFLNGEAVVAKSDVTVWQCPGGADAGGDMLNCVKQYDMGVAPAGTQMTVMANEYGEYAKYGYLRVIVTLTYVPTWAQGQSVTEQTVGWVDAAKVK